MLKNIGVRLHEADARALAAIAKAHGRTVSQEARFVLAAYIREAQTGRRSKDDK